MTFPLTVNTYGIGFFWEVIIAFVFNETVVFSDIWKCCISQPLHRNKWLKHQLNRRSRSEAQESLKLSIPFSHYQRQFSIQCEMETQNLQLNWLWRRVSTNFHAYLLKHYNLLQYLSWSTQMFMAVYPSIPMLILETTLRRSLFPPRLLQYRLMSHMSLFTLF